MTFLIFLILASTGIIIALKLFPRFAVDTDQAIAINYITAATLGIVIDSTHTPLSGLVSAPWFYFSMLVGVILIAGFFLFALSAQKAGVAVTAIGTRMSVVIPVIAGFVLFHDEAMPTKIAGILLALVALYLSSRTDNKAKIDKKYIYLPLILFFAAGINDTMIKMAQEWYVTDDYFEFVYTSFFFAFIVGVGILIFRKKIRSFSFNTIVGGIILGLINFCSIFFLVRGLSLMQVSTFMPVYNVSVVVLTSLIGYVVFKERLSAVNWSGILLAVIAIILIAMK